MIRILIVDDHRMFRRGLRMILEDSGEVEVVGEADNGDLAMKLILEAEPDLVLLDVSLPGRGALEILARCRRKLPGLAVVILTMHDDDLLALRFMKAGASGYLTKDTDPELLLGAIRNAHAGRRTITPTLAERLLDATLDLDPEVPRHTLLSTREFTVFQRLASGQSITRIGLDLAISPRTASTYRRRVLDKLKLANNAELTHYAFKHGLVS
ncbi:MAG: response regulator transcription factor [Magnetococcales bacterium]|nr:response regulator transcription factor [Magnetococcales bacterium]MBF0156876.1 response regulator transcription factor [Magnetococcales bacterium]